MKRLLIVMTAAVVLLGASLSAQDANLAETGKKIFSAKQCTKCHMVAGVGNKVGKLDGVATKVSAADMRRWLTQPLEMEKTLDHQPKIKMSSKIVALALKESDITALIAYLQTLK